MTPYAFTADEISDLLAELDERLRRAGISAAAFIVGGAAVAVRSSSDRRRTEDVDAITRDEILVAESRAIARERGLPEDWLNGSAAMWMPPLPDGVLDHRAEPGLRVTYASDEFLLATKLIASRRKDAEDVRELAERTDMTGATAHALEALIYRYYTDQGALEMIIDGTDVSTEVRLLAEAAARMLSRDR